MYALNHTYRLKEEIIGPHNRYIGSNVDKVHTDNGKKFWSMYCVYYLQKYIKNVEDILYKDRGACIKQYGKGKRP